MDKSILDSINGVTIWDSPTSKLQSQFGVTTYREWCELECQRMNLAGANNYVAAYGQGEQEFVCIARRD